MFNNTIVLKDIEYIFGSLTKSEIQKLNGSSILVTGCAGFLGFYFLHFFAFYAKELNIKKIIGLDTFIVGKPKWLEKIVLEHSDLISLNEFNISRDEISSVEGASECNLILHMASIASPTIYRKYPLETIDGNVWGLRKLLDYYCERDIKGFLFFSSSEVYGEPDPSCVPTSEDYRGNVATVGPRACYDESKRFGETLCSIFWEKYGLPVTVARPFNNYGPGIKLHDKRVASDFGLAVIENRDIIIHSDGRPMRTFCYNADGISGYLKVLLYGKFDYFNIGIDKPEISIKQFAEHFQIIGAEQFGYTGSVKYEKSLDEKYLVDNPNRRCPVITKAKTLLDYNPTIGVKRGIGNFLEFLKITDGVL